MGSEVIHRPKWEIDIRLECLIGEHVRVVADSFSPARWNGEAMPTMISAGKLILPDNSPATGLPLFFEGILKEFVRRVGVVYVRIEPPSFSEQSAEGIVCFRGKTAVILSGPATVQLAYPFVIEKLPSAIDNYWQDLRFSRVQFKLPF